MKLLKQLFQKLILIYFNNFVRFFLADFCARHSFILRFFISAGQSKPKTLNLRGFLRRSRSNFFSKIVLLKDYLSLCLKIGLSIMYKLINSQEICIYFCCKQSQFAQKKKKACYILFTGTHQYLKYLFSFIFQCR